ARKSCRIPTSPKNEAIFRTTTSKPGMERSVFSAARSAGCSHAVEAIWISFLRSGINWMAEGRWPVGEGNAHDYGMGRPLVSQIRLLQRLVRDRPEGPGNPRPRLKTA